MEIKYFVDADGKYYGGFGGGALPPDGAIEVPIAPEHGRQIWDGVAWGVVQQTWDDIRETRKPLMDDAIIVLERHFSQSNFGITTSITNEKAAEWAVYLQTLRGIPQTFPTPNDVIWPEKP